MIRTRRLLLRPARPDDLMPLHKIFSVPQTMRYWSHPAHEDLAPTQAFLKGFTRENPIETYQFILDLDGHCVGKAGVWTEPEVGFILHHAHWGNGLVREAMATILPHAFDVFPDCDALTAEVDPRNTASCRLLERLGFQIDRIGEQDFLYGGTGWCDTAYYRLPRAGFHPAGDKR